MMVCLLLVLLASIGFAPWAEASVIELPGANSTKSGVDIFSGWKCVANGDITVRFDGGTPIVIPYGSERNDTISICGDADNGYVLLLNYNTLGPGSHTAEVFDDGVSFASVSFTVVTTGTEFLAGVSGTGTVTLSNGQVLTIHWSESAQGFEIISISTPSTSQSALTETVSPLTEAVSSLTETVSAVNEMPPRSPRQAGQQYATNESTVADRRS